MDEKTNEIEKLKFHVFRDERFIDLNLYQFGWERTSPTHSYGPYARNHYLFHYAIAGRGVLLANGTEYEVPANHGFLIVPGQITTYRSNPEDPWEYTWLNLTDCGPTRACTWQGSAAASRSTPPATPRPAGRSRRRCCTSSTTPTPARST